MRHRRHLILPRSLSLFLNQSRRRLPVPEEVDPQEQQIRRLRAERVEWANMATVARLDRDRLQGELLNAKRDADWLRGQNQRLWTVVACVEALFLSRTWSQSSLRESDATPVSRLRNAVGVLRRATLAEGREIPIQEAFKLDGHA